MEENQKVHQIMVKDLKVPPNKLQASHSARNKSHVVIVDCRRRQKKFQNTNHSQEAATPYKERGGMGLLRLELESGRFIMLFGFIYWKELSIERLTGSLNKAREDEGGRGLEKGGEDDHVQNVLRERENRG
ncbi:hypothetical protein POTOM_004796 [Populus tomentosa]|uniref:Uncharacterized protein n=1 Tax=Populus tomentosa TaxID=118781 RepID=A0A8X8DFK2_POPTO|nr:hypothetical protein POTOM_004796 [Populus tomentosa]